MARLVPGQHLIQLHNYGLTFRCDLLNVPLSNCGIKINSENLPQLRCGAKRKL